jgi:hypothetical protein
MQQLQSLYRGDSSPSLAQIFGMQYQPQNATSQMAQAALTSGMSAGAQVKTTAMNNATQVGIADANRFENRRQFGLTNQLANRQQSEIERNNLASNAYNDGMLANTTRTTDFNTGGNVDIADNDAAQQGQTMLTMIDTQIQALDKSDPNYNAQVAALQQRRQSIANQLAAGKKAGRGGMTGVMKVLTPEVMRPFGRDGKPAQGGIADYVSTIVDRANAQAPAPTPAAAPAAAPAPVAAQTAPPPDDGLTEYDRGVLADVRVMGNAYDTFEFTPMNMDDFKISSAAQNTYQPTPGLQMGGFNIGSGASSAIQPPAGIKAQGIQAPEYRKFSVPGLKIM